MKKLFFGSAPPTTLTGPMSTFQPVNGTAFTVVNATGYPHGADYFVVAVGRNHRLADGTLTEEKLLVTRSFGSNTLTLHPTLGRGFDSTVARDHIEGESVEHVIDADTMTELENHVFDTARNDHTQYLLRSESALTWSDWTDYTPKLGAVNLTTKTMVEDTYDNNSILRGRYRMNGHQVYAEFVLVPGSNEPNIRIGSTDPVFTVHITGSPGGGTFQLAFESILPAPTFPPFSVLVTFAWSVTAPAMQTAIRAADGRLNSLGVTVTGTNPNFTITMPRNVLGSDFAHPLVLLNNNSLTGGSSPNVVVTQTVFEDLTDDVFYIGLPLPMDATNMWNYADDSDGGQKWPVRLGEVFASYDGFYSPSMTGPAIAFPMSTDNPNFNPDYLNWMAFISETFFAGAGQGQGYPAYWDNFDLFGGSQNIITGSITYFTSAAGGGGSNPNFWEYSGGDLQPDPAATQGITDFTVALASNRTVLDIFDPGGFPIPVNTAITLNGALDINSTAGQDWSMQAGRDVDISATGGVPGRDVNITANRNTDINGNSLLMLSAGASRLNARLLLYSTNDVVLTAPVSAPSSGDLVTDGSAYGSLAFYLDEAGNNLKVKVKYHNGTIKTGTIPLV